MYIAHNQFSLNNISINFIFNVSVYLGEGRRGRMVVGFTAIPAISAYYH
jgi:hypothetical protein